MKWRLADLAGGFVAIQSVNILCLISLFYLGQSNRSLFEFAHGLSLRNADHYRHHRSFRPVSAACPTDVKPSCRGSVTSPF